MLTPPTPWGGHANRSGSIPNFPGLEKRMIRRKSSCIPPSARTPIWAGFGGHPPLPKVPRDTHRAPGACGAAAAPGAGCPRRRRGARSRPGRTSPPGLAPGPAPPCNSAAPHARNPAPAAPQRGEARRTEVGTRGTGQCHGSGSPEAPQASASHLGDGFEPFPCGIGALEPKEVEPLRLGVELERVLDPAIRGTRGWLGDRGVPRVGAS